MSPDPVATTCLVALDPATPDPSALLDAAGQHARAFGSPIIVLGAVHPKVLAGDGGDASDAGPSPAEAQARASLDVAAAQLRSQGLAATSLVRAGALEPLLADSAHRHHASLVVLGARRRHRLHLADLFRRDRRAAIARRLPCPTLLVGTAEGAKAAQAAEPAAAGDATLDRDEAPAASALPSVRTGVRSFDADSARAGPAVPHAVGARTVEVARIVGSVGRVDGVDARFHQFRPGARDDARYGHFLRAVESGAALPPVDLYKLGYGYYLLDGHRRVAAAHAVGQLWIDATVTEFVPVADRRARSALAARRTFEQATGLTQLDAALPDTYARLGHLIRAFAARHRLDDPREAAVRWYARAFRPFRARLRAARAHERLPDERSADIFVRLATQRNGDCTVLPSS